MYRRSQSSWLQHIFFSYAPYICGGSSSSAGSASYLCLIIMFVCSFDDMIKSQVQDFTRVSFISRNSDYEGKICITLSNAAHIYPRNDNEGIRRYTQRDMQDSA
uniref:Uncharacterized protein n=1 Tax=Parascaris univalens TaxID=6257 RepID=A0A914ZGT6_PARUN